MNSLLSRISRRLRRQFLTPAAINKLLASKVPEIQAAGRATQKAAQQSQTPEEAAWFTQIEQRRAELLARKDSVPVPDYGAGAPSDTRSENEMLSGVMTTQVVGEACLNYSKEPLWASLLFHYVREFKPAIGVELGTCLGLSASYQSAAMELNQRGKLVTLEGSDSFGAIASEGLAKLGLADRCSVVVGRFFDTLPGVLKDLGKLDYAFIDGHHDEQATIKYFEELLPHLASNALLVFDDITWSPGMSKAWTQICQRKEIASWVDYQKVGVCWLGGAKQPGVTIQL